MSMPRALAALLCLAPALGQAQEAPLPPEGQTELRTESVVGSDAPRVVVRAVLPVPARKVWQIVSDCATYQDHLPRVAASKLLQREGAIHVCEVTVAMPFPLSNLTAVTRAVHTESATGMSRRWTLERGDYHVNQGSWEVTPLGDGTRCLVVYTIHAKPKTRVPGWMQESAQKKALPELFERVRTEAAKLP